jgi:hypothetical protein
VARNSVSACYKKLAPWLRPGTVRRTGQALPRACIKHATTPRKPHEHNRRAACRRRGATPHRQRQHIPSSELQPLLLTLGKVCCANGLRRQRYARPSLARPSVLRGTSETQRYTPKKYLKTSSPARVWSFAPNASAGQSEPSSPTLRHTDGSVARTLFWCWWRSSMVLVTLEA